MIGSPDLKPLIQNGPLLVAPPLIVFAFCLTVVIAEVRGRDSDLPVERVSVIAVIGGLAVLLVVRVSVVALFFVLIGVLGRVYSGGRVVATPIRQAITGYSTALVAGAMLTVVRIGQSVPPAVALSTTVQGIAISLPFVAMVPLGGAIRHESANIMFWAAIPIISFVCVPAILIPDTAGALLALQIMAMIGIGVLSVVIGLVPLFLGYQSLQSGQPSP